MSKSLGTGIDPLDLIDGGPRPPGVRGPAGDFPAYGADAVRWGLLAMSSSQDVRFSEEKVAQGLQLTNKLWNASRLILLRRRSRRRGRRSTRARSRTAGSCRGWSARRPRSRRGSIATTSRTRRSELYDFVYGELCDWYLELVKPRLYDGEQRSRRRCCTCSTETLALAHPIIPFVTEEIYGYVPGAEGLLAAGVGAAPRRRSTSRLRRRSRA